jgi:hypothetical protein
MVCTIATDAVMTAHMTEPAHSQTVAESTLSSRAVPAATPTSAHAPPVIRPDPGRQNGAWLMSSLVSGLRLARPEVASVLTGSLPLSPFMCGLSIAMLDHKVFDRTLGLVTDWPQATGGVVAAQVPGRTGERKFCCMRALRGARFFVRANRFDIEGRSCLLRHGFGIPVLSTA